jgi:hypothetical protein
LVSEKKGTFKLDAKANTGIIYVPADITKDSGFPLIPRNVKIRIEDKHLIIESLPRFEYIGLQHDRVMLIDNRMGSQCELIFREDDSIYCDLCRKTTCDHIDYARNTAEVNNYLRKCSRSKKK